MCQTKSGIILKDRIFLPDYDSHGKMLEELKIKDTRENAERLFVRAELLPSDGDVFSDISTWRFRVDQDILPEWFVAEYEEKRMREAVADWAKAHIHIDEDNLHLSDGRHIIKGGKGIVIDGTATVDYIVGESTVDYIGGKATINSIGGESKVYRIGEKSTVDCIGGIATVFTSKYSEWKNLKNAQISDDAMVKDCFHKIIYQAGDWEFRKV